MFAIATFLLIIVSVTNLAGLALGKTPSIREISVQLIGLDDGVQRLTGALIFAVLAQVYLVFLIFPLKALNYYLGLAWSILMLVAICETIHTTRKMYTTVAEGKREETFPLHDSPFYQVYQVVYNISTIGVCTYLLLPR